MEIKYSNKIEDYEVFFKHFAYKYIHFTRIKYFISSIAFISGIYYSIELKNIMYFFTNSIVMTLIVFYLLKIMEPNYINKLSKKLALKNFKKYENIANEKTLIIDNKLVIINYKNSTFKMKLNKDTKLDIIDKYIMILNVLESGYKSKLIIPINVFNSEEEKNKFINYIKEMINIKVPR
ncbi:hypothetical protein [Clostridium sp. 1001275B_160808_H3]|uniref:hypothetical protein n=1 Tax=Clostridium sp. 1001275B_160808_H3 TaxID=2787110 RepID=UPI0018993289|nr:hypothetical protein [Clostridium sp. 1001275B_160808_H3]